MSDTLVIQSHRSPLPYRWIERCLCSVRDWAQQNHYDYHYIDDSLFDLASASIKNKYRDNPVVMSDLARLLVLKQALDNGYKTTVWLDADFLVFCPSAFVLSDTLYAVGREVWIQHDGNGKPKSHIKVHNALLLFRQGNSFLDFYLEVAERLLNENTGDVPPQFVGPKLLTALHNVVQLPVMETAGMFSPPVIKAILDGNGEALACFRKKSRQPVAGANLCISSCDRQQLSEQEMEKLIDVLMSAASLV